MTKQIILGVSGEPGSFSEEAGWLYAKNHGLNPLLRYLTDMEGVLSAVENNEVDLGIFPIVNLCGGLVRMALDAMGRHAFTVQDELWLNVQQCLLVKPGASLDTLKQVVSHSQALAQCQRYLREHLQNAKQIEWQDTALAAKDLAEGKLSPDSAVIAPAAAAALYGLNILAKNIQDENPNLTAFIIVKKRGE